MRNQEQRVGKLIGTRRWAAGRTPFECLTAAFTPGASVAADFPHHDLVSRWTGMAEQTE